MNVLLLGATGLVGGELLKLLLSCDEVKKIKVITRHNISQNSEKIEVIIDPMHDLSHLENVFNEVDHVYCCLGTTIKKAKSKQMFRHVDLELPLQAALLSKRLDVSCFTIVTALGSSSDSSVFYNRVKGELEDELKRLSLQKLIIIKPSLLLGTRNETRLLENIGQAMAPFINSLIPASFARIRAVRASEVAELMLALSQDKEFRSDIIRTIYS